MKRYGISETRRFIVELSAYKNAVVKIDHKLPYDAEFVTGVRFCIMEKGNLKGQVSLRFSEGISNTLLLQGVSTSQSKKRKKEKYTPVWEPVSDASTLKGYYRDGSVTNKNYILKIYIEYLPRKK